MTEVSYVTRETVQHVLNQADSVRNNRRIDESIQAGSRDVESWLHRRFYPTLATRYPAPSRVIGRWLDLDHIDYELLSITSLTLDGTAAGASDYYLYPEVPGQGRGHTSIRAVPAGSLAWPSTERAIVITGTFGSSDTTRAAGSLAAAITTTTATTLTLSDSSLAGVGDLLTVDTERMIITEKEYVYAGTYLTADATATATDTTIEVADGTLVKQGEMILIGAERMFVEAVTNNTLVVKRAQNASTLAAHVSTDVVNAPRLATVERGVTGTTAATHLISAAVRRNDPPSLVQELALAFALNNLEQGRAGYAREVGQGEGAREAGGRGIRAITEDAFAAYGRVRSAAV